VAFMSHPLGDLGERQVLYLYPIGLYSENVPLSKRPVVETSQSHNVPSQNVPPWSKRPESNRPHNTLPVLKIQVCIDVIDVIDKHMLFTAQF